MFFRISNEAGKFFSPIVFSCHISCDALRCAGAGDQSPHSDGVSTVHRDLRELPSVPDGGHGWTRAIHGTPRAQMDYIVRARRTAYGCVHQGPLYGARRMQRKTVLAPRDVSRWGRAPLAGHRQAPIALTVCCRATTITHNTQPCSVTAVGSKGAVGRRMGGEQIMRRAGSREKKTHMQCQRITARRIDHSRRGRRSMASSNDVAGDLRPEARPPKPICTPSTPASLLFQKFVCVSAAFSSVSFGPSHRAFQRCTPRNAPLPVQRVLVAPATASESPSPSLLRSLRAPPAQSRKGELHQADSSRGVHPAACLLTGHWSFGPRGLRLRHQAGSGCLPGFMP
ncbi:hypothetical protein M432DRAFT_309220 [Thermoascus aurantiacus ATCC 26904]